MNNPDWLEFAIWILYGVMFLCWLGMMEAWWRISKAAKRQEGPPMNHPKPEFW